MTSNTKEYQREYQKEYRKTHPQKQYKKVKMEVKKVKILQPPKMVEKTEERRDIEILTSTTLGESGSKTIDFSYLTNNSSFQRAIMEFIRKFVPGLETLKVRGNKEVINKSIYFFGHGCRKHNILSAWGEEVKNIT